jgi:putative transposase
MPRANRHFLPVFLWHITHRCHKKEFPLKFARDRQCWLGWLFEAKKRYGLYIKLRCDLQPYTFTGEKYKIQNTKYKIQNTKYKIQNTKYKIQVIAKSLQLIAGRRAQEYNQRK